MNNIYVLYGINKFLIDHNLKKIISNNDIEEYDLEEISIQDVLNYARELPMFSDFKYVVCDNSLFLSSSKSKIEHNVDDLIQYIKNPVKSTILVFIVRVECLDNRKKVNTLLNENAKIIECNNIETGDIFKFAKSSFSNNGIKISDDLVRYLIDRVNSNMDILNQEISKLCLYDDVITKNIIDDLVNENVDDDVFSFIDSIIKNDKKRMFIIYDESIKKGLEPIQIIAMLYQEFKIIYQVRILTKQGYSDKDIMDILGIYKVGRIKFARGKARELSNDKLLSEMYKLSELDISIKTGDMDKYIAFEKYLLEL